MRQCSLVKAKDAPKPHCTSPWRRLMRTCVREGTSAMPYDPATMEVSVTQEVAATFMQRPHVVLVGAGASKAALPAGDANGVPVLSLIHI